ncbi:hypothetical protein QMA77_22565 [Pantoea ananatis]|uniref:hypothetical protein n=1 Tax=Pantoea ananas TaxID=553 RepID=UPI0024ADF3F9|nr:hypothetical protein [Pantoea ananatis]MDI6539703.1 hypothetical protein [Pantoea ananatis]
MTWFGFLHGFCSRPLLQHQMQIRGLSFAAPLLRVPRSHRLHFQEAAGRICHRHLCLLLMRRKMMADIRARLERNVDVLLFDEVQGFANHDFNFLLELCSAGISVLLAGDCCHHTFGTSRDGNTNVTSHNNITCQKPVLHKCVCCQTGKPSAKHGAAHRQYVSLSHQSCIYLSKHTYPVSAGLEA